MIPKTYMEKRSQWGLLAAKVDNKGEALIQEMGWTQTDDGLWLAPKAYEGSYLEGTKTSAIVASFLERIMMQEVKKSITKAAKVFE